MNADAHLADWPPPELYDPLHPLPAPPTELGGWHRRSGTPDQPDPSGPTVYELHASARGGWTTKPAKKRAASAERRKRRRRR